MKHEILYESITAELSSDEGLPWNIIGIGGPLSKYILVIKFTSNDY